MRGNPLNLRFQKYSHDNENSADNDTLNPAAKNRLGDNRQSLVDNHVGQQEGDKQEVAILANGQNLVGILFLLPTKREM